MKLFIPIGFIFVFLLSACDDNDDQTKNVNKDGGIEVSLSTAHLDSVRDQLTTHYIVWRGGAKVKEFDKRDTIPSLGKFFTEGENNNGDTQSLSVNKDYEFFVTVK